MRNLVILIVAYRAADKLENCLRSIQRHLMDLEVHVWDNSGQSHPGVRLLAEDHPGIKWHFSEINIGFAAAINAMAAKVPNSDLLLLNPDAELVGPLWLTRNALGSPHVAAAAPMTDDPGPGPRPSRFFARRREPWDVAHRGETFVSALGAVAGLGDRLRDSWFSNLYRRRPADVSGYLTGACLAINREAWESVGPFDEEYFLYGEESDWQRRAISAGWKLLLSDEIGIRHQAMGTVDGDPTGVTRSHDLLRANMGLSMEYRYGRFAANCFLAWCGLVDTLRLRIRERARLPAGSEFLLTTDGPQSLVEARVSTAVRLANAGHSVTVMSLQRLGSLPRDLPASIRLIRGSWWWPSATPQRLPSVLVAGTTSREKAIARRYQLTPGKRCISTNQAIMLCSRTRIG